MGILNPKVQSDLAVLKDDVFVNTAGSINLDSVARNLGLERPLLGWHNDEHFRALVRKLSVTPHPPVQAIRILLELVLGPACTKVRTLNAGQGSPATLTGGSGPFAITGGTNDVLTISAQGMPASNITLTAGGAVTATTIAGDINAADVQVVASVVSGNLQIVASGTIIGRHSTIEITDNFRSAHTTLGLSLGIHRGVDNLGIGNTKFRFDRVDERYTADPFPQWAKKLILDEHGPTQETVDYDFHETGSLSTVEVTTKLTQVHGKWLPVAGTTLQASTSVGGTSLTVLNNTGFPAGTYFAIMINRGELTEEYIQVASRVGSVFTLSTPLRFAHIDGESVELLYTQTLAPSIAANTAAGVSQLTLNDSSIFPKANFTIIVARDTQFQETFWISENDHDGTGSTGTANTLVINGTHHATAPANTAHAHDAGVLVEPAQVQLKGCGWRVEETTASPEVKIVIPDCCIDYSGSMHAFIHEAIKLKTEPGNPLTTVNITANVSAGATEVQVATGDLTKLWGDNVVQDYVDKKVLQRSCVLEDGATTEERAVIKVKEATRLVPHPIASGASSTQGYPAGSTTLYVEDGDPFKALTTPFNVVINRGGTNEEVVACSNVTYSPPGFFPGIHWRLTVGATTKSHGYFLNPATPAATGGDIGESVELTPNINLVLASELENSYAAATANIQVINTPPFLYAVGVPDPDGRIPLPSASDLQDGGSGHGEAHKLQNGRYAGYFLFESPSSMPQAATSSLATAVTATTPEAVRKIPAPTEILGYCTSDPTAAAPGFTQNGSLPPGTQYIVVADIQVWPPLAGDATNYPYPIVVGKDTGDEEKLVNVHNKILIGAATPDIAVSDVKGLAHSSYQPGILVVNLGTGNPHSTFNPSTGDRGDKCVLQVEQLLIANGTHFPAASSPIFLDFGYPSQEQVRYSSRIGKALIFDPPAEFAEQHPATESPYVADLDPRLSGIPSSYSEVMVRTEASYSIGHDGNDFPIYIPGDPTGKLIHGVGLGSVVDAIRSAGIKVVITDGDTHPCGAC